MAEFTNPDILMTPRIAKLKEDLFKEMPAIETERAELLTESYMVS